MSQDHLNVIIGVKLKSDAGNDLEIQLSKLKNLSVNVAVKIDSSELKDFIKNINLVTEELRKAKQANDNFNGQANFSGGVPNIDNLRKGREEINGIINGIEVSYDKSGKWYKVVESITDKLGQIRKFTYSLGRDNDGREIISVNEKTLDNVEKTRTQLERLQKTAEKIKADGLKLIEPKEQDAVIARFNQINNLIQKMINSERVYGTKSMNNIKNRITGMNQLYGQYKQEQEILLKLGRIDRQKPAGLDVSNRAAVTSYVQEVYKGRAVITDFGQTVDKNGKLIQHWTVRLKTGKNEFQTFKESVIRGSDDIRKGNVKLGNELNRGLGIMEQFKVTMRRLPLWMAGSAAFYAMSNQIHLGMTYLKEIDKEMTNLKKVTEGTTHAYREFAIEANNIGAVLGKTTQTVIRSAVTFGRLGYNLRESAILAREALLLSNVGDINPDDASEHIILMTKGFGIQIDEHGKNVRRIIDITNEIGNNFAITQKGIGEVLRRSSASLKEAGNSINEAISMAVAANAAVQNPATVGTALKTISMRLRGVQEEGEEVTNIIPKLDYAFQSIGLTLMKNENQFKSTYEIFDELAGVWHTLTDVERAGILELVAGKRQAHIVASMLNNWKDAQEALKTTFNATGSAMREQEKYMESWEFKAERLKNSIVRFWQTTVNTAFFKAVVDGINSMLSAFTNLIDKIGLTPIILTSSMVAFALWNKELFKSVTGVFALDKSLVKLKATMNASTLSAVTFAGALNVVKGVLATIGVFLKTFIIPIAVVGVISTIIGRIIKLNREMEETIQRAKDLANTWDNEKESVNGLLIEYERLSAIKKSGGTLDVEQEARYFEIADKINNLMPNLISHIDSKGRVHLKTGEALRTEIKYMEDLAKIERELLINNAKAESAKIDSAYQDKINNRDKIGQQLQFARNMTKLALNAETEQKWRNNALNLQLKHTEASREANVELEKKRDLVRDIVSAQLDESNIKLNAEASAFLNELIDKADVAGKDINFLTEEIMKLAVESNKLGATPTTKKLESFNKEIKDIGVQLGLTEAEIENLINALLRLNALSPEVPIRDLNAILFDTTNTTNEFMESIESLGDIYVKLSEGQFLSNKEILEAVKKHRPLLSALKNNKGQLTLNKEAVKLLMEQRQDQFRSDIDLAIREKDILAKNLLAKLDIYHKEAKAITALGLAKEEVAKMNMRSGLVDWNNPGGLFAGKGKNNSVVRELEALKTETEFLLLLKDADLSGGARKGTQKETKSDNKNIELEKWRNELGLIADREREINDIQERRNFLTSDSQKIASYQREVNLQRQLIPLYENLLKKQRAFRVEKAKEFNQFTVNGKRVVTVSKDLETLNVNEKLFNRLSMDKREILKDIIEEYEKYNKSINDSSKSLVGIQSNIKDINEAMKKDLETMVKDKEDKANELINSYKKVLEQRRDIAIRTIEQEIDKEKELHDARMKSFDEQLEGYRKVIQARIDALDKDEDENTFQKNLAEAHKERAEIQRQINTLSLDDSLSARARIVELTEELAKQDEKIQEMQHKRTIDIRKENYQNNLETMQSQIENAKTTEEMNFKTLSDSLEKKRIKEEYYWEELLNNERKFAKIRADIMSGNINHLEKELITFLVEFGKVNEETAFDMELSYQSLRNIIDEIIKSLQKLDEIDFKTYNNLKKQLENFNSNTIPNVSVNQVNTPVTRPTTTPTTQPPTTTNRTHRVVQGDTLSGISRRLLNDANRWREIYELNRTLIGSDPNLIRVGQVLKIPTRHKGGIVGSETGGRLVQLINELFNTKPNERIVKALEDEVMIPAKNIGSNFIPNMRKMALNSAFSQGDGGIGQVIYNIDFKIERLIGDESGAKTILETVINGIKKKGGII